jgi:hypothetical protein
VQLVARYDLQVHACLGHAAHPFGPAPPNSALSARNEIHWLRPAISKRAMATKAKPRAFHPFSVVASNARSRLKFP